MSADFVATQFAYSGAEALGPSDNFSHFTCIYMRDGYATGILVQKHRSHYRPVVYYSFCLWSLACQVALDQCLQLPP